MRDKIIYVYVVVEVAAIGMHSASSIAVSCPITVGSEWEQLRMRLEQLCLYARMHVLWKMGASTTQIARWLDRVREGGRSVLKLAIHIDSSGEKCFIRRKRDKCYSYNITFT